MASDFGRVVAPADPAAAALFGKTRRAVIAALFGNPERAYYLRELSRLAGGGLGSVQRELQGLRRAGLVGVRREGGRTFYQALPEAALFPELAGIARKIGGPAPAVAAALTPLRRKIRVAFIYGSMARGRQRQASDVDVMVIGTVAVTRVVSALRPLVGSLGRELNPTVFSPAEFRRKLAGRNHFLSHVMTEPKLFVLGGADELKAVAGQ
jgi:predicted nucleotidyltransferase